MDQQEEERDVLDSIYGEDERFKQVSPSVIQYKFGPEGSKNSFLLEIHWNESYPSCGPGFNLNAFYNNHLSSEMKKAIVRKLYDESYTLLGEAQTYTMIEWARENCEKLLTSCVETKKEPSVGSAKDDDAAGVVTSEAGVDTSEPEVKSKIKKEQLTKSQKRKEWDRKDNKGEVVRGKDWVDVVRHLSQTGPQE